MQKCTYFQTLNIAYKTVIYFIKNLKTWQFLAWISEQFSVECRHVYLREISVASEGWGNSVITSRICISRQLISIKIKMYWGEGILILLHFPPGHPLNSLLKHFIPLFILLRYYFLSHSLGHRLFTKYNSNNTNPF